MKQIKDLQLYVGTKEEYQFARQKGMKIVCALQRANGFVTHQSVVGWQGMDLQQKTGQIIKRIYHI